jgi:hypothetical protein
VCSPSGKHTSTALVLDGRSWKRLSRPGWQHPAALLFFSLDGWRFPILCERRSRPVNLFSSNKHFFFANRSNKHFYSKSAPLLINLEST